MSSPVARAPEKPDGGWGWVIVISAAFIHIFNTSVPYSFGLIFGQKLNDMGHGTYAASLLTSMRVLSSSITGCILGPASKKCTPRTITYFGCFLTASGLMICAVSIQLWQLIMGYSIIVGIGISLIQNAAFMAINSWFSHKRGTAVAMAGMGVNVGQIIVPHLVGLLLDNYGYRYTLLIIGTLALSGFLGASSFRTVKKNPLEVSAVETIKTGSDVGSSRNFCQKFLDGIVKAFDLELLKDPILWNILIGLSLCMTASESFTMIFPIYLEFSAGLSKEKTALCMSSVAIADFVTRVPLSYLTDRLKCPYRLSLFCGIIITLIGRLALAETSDFTTLMEISALLGGSRSPTTINVRLSVAEHCKPQKLAGALGLLLIFAGFSSMTLGQLIGWIRDYTGSYTLCIQVQSALPTVMVILWSIEMAFRHREFLLKRRRRRESSNEPADSIDVTQAAVTHI